MSLETDMLYSVGSLVCLFVVSDVATGLSVSEPGLAAFDLDVVSVKFLTGSVWFAVARTSVGSLSDEGPGSLHCILPLGFKV